MDDTVLKRGVESGIITPEQADRLRSLAGEDSLSGPALSPDDEQLRLITSFSDIFVTIGIALFLSPVAWFASGLGGAFGMCGVLAIASWLLAEYFTRRRRMALPSIVLLLVYAISIFFATAYLIIYVTGIKPAPTSYSLSPGFSPTVLIVSGIVTAALTAFHYWRFRVPVTIAAGCAAIAVSVVGLGIAIAPAAARLYLNAIVFVCGIAIFALAMRFDTSDRERLTRRADIAFWLHLLAAPLIVHSLISSYLSITEIESGAAAITIAVFVVLSAVAVLIDRRAMLVSGLSYAGFSFSSLIKSTGLSDLTIPVTLLVLGGFILLLSAGWRSLRGHILDFAPNTLVRHLPPRTAQS